MWKNLPLEMHKNAMPAALAAMAADAQGKFWPYHDKLFGNQQKLERDSLIAYARELGLDVGRFQSDLDAARYKSKVDADSNEAKALGVTGTPAFFVNGRFLSGARPFEDFQKLIDAELARMGQAAPKG